MLNTLSSKKKRILILVLSITITFIITAGISSKDFIINFFTKLEMDELSMDFSKARLLVIAPHNDDETLGCGNLISKVVKSGGEAKIILLTNGDGHASAVAVSYLTVKPKAKDYIRSAYARQAETEKAMRKAGIEKSNIIYLGYPDGGLYSMWKENWDETSLFESNFTEQNYSPYTNSYKLNAPYCGKSLAEDLEKIILDYEPSIIAFPHPNDQHPDHFSAYCFTKYVLEKNKLYPEQYLYLVHRGKWPSPMGLFSTMFLVPPRELIDLGTQWLSLSMDETEVKEKIDMIRKYRSQLNVNGPFLKAFIRRNELFGIYHDLKYGFKNKYSPTILLIEDPSNDNLLRKSIKSGDIRKLYLGSDKENLILSLDIENTPKNGNSYHFDMHFFSYEGNVFRINMTVRLDATIDLLADTSENIPSIDGIKISFDTSMLNVSIPYTSIPNFDSILISASTSSNYRLLDRTAWRLVRN